MDKDVITRRAPSASSRATARSRERAPARALGLRSCHHGLRCASSAAAPPPALGLAPSLLAQHACVRGSSCACWMMTRGHAAGRNPNLDLLSLTGGSLPGVLRVP